MRIKNEKANKSAYIKTEKRIYDSIISWIKNSITEQVKSKCKIIQAKLLDFFRKSKPTTEQVIRLLNILKSKYLPSDKYPSIRLTYEIINSIDDNKTLYFNVFIDFNGIYKRLLIQENGLPNIDGKTVILNIEITDEELSEIVRERAISEGGFEEI